jgi:hypothetical protein
LELVRGTVVLLGWCAHADGTGHPATKEFEILVLVRDDRMRYPLLPFVPEYPSGLVGSGPRPDRD